MNTELVPQPNGALIVTTDQLELVRKTIAPDATPSELELYLYDCKRQGVHPLDRLLHFTKRGGRYTPITSIDLMRARASDTGELAGSEDAEFIETEGGDYPFSARVTVHRLVSGQRCPFTATARWAEYYPGDGKEGFMWRKMHHVMLAKCAEALALRKAFPRQLAGMYAREEMDQAGSPVRPDAPSRSPVPSSGVGSQKAGNETPDEAEAALRQAPEAPPAPVLSAKERVAAFLDLLKRSKSQFLSQVKPMLKPAEQYFRALPAHGLLPNEFLADISPSGLFPSADVENTPEANHAALKADFDRHMAGIRAVQSDDNQIPGAEIKDDGYDYVHVPEPQASKPMPAGTESRRIRVKVVTEKHGESKKGPWTRFGVCDADDVWFNTFDKKLGAKAQTLKGQDATIYFVEGERGNDFSEISAD